MVRSLTLAVALALGTVSVPAHALGLGDINSRSALNQQFDADIDLLSVAAGELDSVRVGLASAEAFERAGVERPFFLTMLKFRPVRLENGDAVIRVSSDFPIREPFLNFLIEINWPRGKLVREYTVLLDPPTTTSRRAPQVTPAAAPVATSRPAPTPAVPAPQQVGEGEYGPIQANETLWSIAKRVRPRGVSMEQMMIALQRANPQAFISGNINRLRQGSILRVPGTEEILDISRNEARSAYREQQQDWLTRRSEQMQAAQPQADQPAPVAGAGATGEDDAELRIATPRPEGSGEAGAGEDRGDEATVDEIKSQLLMARENAETSRQESQVLRSEIDELQKRLQDMQRLLSLKDEQLARLQDTVAEGPGAPEVPETEAPQEQAQAEEAPEAAESAMDEAQQQAAAEDAGEAAPAADTLPGTPLDVLAQAADEIAEQANAAGLSGAAAPAQTAPAAAAEPEVAQPEATPAAAEPAPQVAPEPQPEPVAEPPQQEVAAAADDAGMAPAGEETTLGGIKLPEFLGNNLAYLLGGGGLLLILLLLLISRRKSAGEPPAAEPEQADESILTADESDLKADADSTAAGDTSFLSEFSPSDINALRDDTGEVDPVSEADVYIAYGRYQQAEELLTQALQKDPGRLALKHKLLEVHYANRNRDAFVALAQEMVDGGQDIADGEAWTRAKDMGRELDANNPLFEKSADEPRGVEALGAAAAAGAVAGAALAGEQQEDTDLALDDLELSSLASDLSGEESEQVGAEQQTPAAAAKDDADLALDLDDLGDLEAGLDEDSVPVEGLESLELDLPDLDSEDLSSVLRMSDEVETKPAAPDALGGDSMLGEESELSPDALQAQLDELSDLSMLDADLSELTADVEEAPVEESLIEEGVLDQPISLEEAFDADAGVDASPETIELSELGETAETAVDEEAAETKLDLARAYIEMGDQEGARSILDEVVQEGTQAQKDAAGKLLGEMS